MDTILRMNIREILNVENFSVYNNFGKITWPGVTSLINLNLDEIIEIKENSILIYPKNYFVNNYVEIPKKG